MFKCYTHYACFLIPSRKFIISLYGILMLSKNQLKFINSLAQKKQRYLNRCYVAEGAKIVPELIKKRNTVVEVFAVRSWIDANLKSLIGIETTEVSAAELKKISFLTTPNEVLAVLKMPEPNYDWSLIEQQFSLVLDDIRDPGNLGTIIRMADWYGVTDVFCSEETVDVYNPKVVQATMGSLARVKVHYLNITDFITEANKQSISIYGAVLGGNNVYKMDLPEQGMLVIGNESHGIKQPIQKMINKISIPKYGSDIDSLNAAMATAILLSEFKRKF